MVLLDEPTAHLDAAREDGLRDLLAPWLEGRTVVMAAHRGGLVGRVDRTVSLVGGHAVTGRSASPEYPPDPEWTVGTPATAVGESR